MTKAERAKLRRAMSALHEEDGWDRGMSLLTELLGYEPRRLPMRRVDIRVAARGPSQKFCGVLPPLKRRA